MQEVLIKVYGQVQGVGFRYQTWQKATDLGLSGWIKNLPDGKVEILAQGEKAKLEKLIEWVKIGPAFASIEKVMVKWGRPAVSYTSFEILY